VVSLINPFLGAPALFGNNTSLLAYYFNLLTLRSKDSLLLLTLLWSTLIPTLLANYTPNPAALISYKLNPLPYLTFLLYLTV